MEMETFVALHVDGVLDVIAVERDGPRTNGRRERILEHTDLVVVDIHIGEDILHHRIEDIARLHKVVDTAGVHTFDDHLLIVGFLAVDLLRHGLIDGDRQDEFIVVGTDLHLVYQPLFLLVLR